jgi:RND family efflux transporter MFP subunit
MIFARQRLVIALAGGVFLLSACSQKSEAPQGNNAPAAAASAPGQTASAPAGAASAPLPVVTVTTVKAQKRELPVTLKATGTVTPLTSVDLRAQATSTISKVHFNDGQFVKAGQLLFTLDSRTDEANLAKAKAQMAKDNAGLADARRQYERAKQLFGQNFISQGAVDTSLAQVESLAATVAADQAAIDAVKVSLSYNRIVAPVSGRAGVINVSAGSAVIINVTPLVTITQLDPIAVAFSIPQRNLGDALSALKGGGSEVTVTLADNGGSFTGHLQFVDNQIDASAGTVKAKAVFANKEGKLWPGAFVNVSQTVAVLKDAVVLPQAAIVQGVRGTIVYVVQDGKATLKPVKVVYAEAGDAAVTGIKPGELVVLDGKQNVRPNSPVVERAKEPKSGASAPAGAASGPAGAGSAPAGGASGTTQAAKP